MARIAADTAAGQDNLPAISTEVNVAKIPPANVNAPYATDWKIAAAAPNRMLSNLDYKMELTSHRSQSQVGQIRNSER